MLLGRLEGESLRRLWPEVAAAIVLLAAWAGAASEEKIFMKEWRGKLQRLSLGKWYNWFEVPPQFLAKDCSALGPEISATCKETDKEETACRALAVCQQVGWDSSPNSPFLLSAGHRTTLSRVYWTVAREGRDGETAEGARCRVNSLTGRCGAGVGKEALEPRKGLDSSKTSPISGREVKRRTLGRLWVSKLKTREGIWRT